MEQFEKFLTDIFLVFFFNFWFLVGFFAYCFLVGVFYLLVNKQQKEHKTKYLLCGLCIQIF